LAACVDPFVVPMAACLKRAAHRRTISWGFSALQPIVQLFLFRPGLCESTKRHVKPQPKIRGLRVSDLIRHGELLGILIRCAKLLFETMFSPAVHPKEARPCGRFCRGVKAELRSRRRPFAAQEAARPGGLLDTARRRRAGICKWMGEGSTIFPRSTTLNYDVSERFGLRLRCLRRRPLPRYGGDPASTVTKGNMRDRMETHLPTLQSPIPWVVRDRRCGAGMEGKGLLSGRANARRRFWAAVSK